MFAPNRLLTPKEQWLLLGIVAAVLVGSVTLVYYQARQSRMDVYIPEVQERVGPPSAASPTVAAASPVAQVVDAAPDLAIESEVETPEAPPRTIGVAVMGAVHRPDLYFVPEDTRVAELIALAGGATDTADLSDIQLTAPGVDETTLTIPEMPAATRNGDYISLRRASTGALNPPYYRKRPIAPPPSAAVPQAPAPAVHSTQPDETERLNINTASKEQLQQLPGIGAVFAARIIEERQRRPFATVNELTRVSGIGDKRLETLRPLVAAP